MPGGGPKSLRALLEGESLLNDASGLTLFEIFLHYVRTAPLPAPPPPRAWLSLQHAMQCSALCPRNAHPGRPTCTAGHGVAMNPTCNPGPCLTCLPCPHMHRRPWSTP